MASKNPPDQATFDQEVVDRDSLLEFPCRFPVKAMGRNDHGFQVMVERIILAHAEIFADEPVTTNPSGSGTYLAVTVTIEAHSREQLDRIYQDLTDCEHVLVAL